MLPLLFVALARGQSEEDVAEEIVVWGDLFARWDDTRWFIATELGLPFPFAFAKDENLSFGSREFQIRTILRCNKDWKLGRRRYEVGCVIEDFAMQAAIDERRVKEGDITKAQAVLDEIDAKLSGAAVQLQVADDGRVTNIDLEGVTADNSREQVIAETLRQVMGRIVFGFDLKLQKYNQLHEGKWPEYNSKLMTFPLPPEVGGAPSSSLIVHYLNRYKGHILVQSIGKGVVQLPLDDTFNPTWTTDLIGVSLFDPDQGFMLERVWALSGESSASAMFDQGAYFHAGRITMLGAEDKPDLGPTRVVNGRRQHTPELPAWEPIER